MPSSQRSDANVAVSAATVNNPVTAAVNARTTQPEPSLSPISPRWHPPDDRCRIRQMTDALTRDSG